MMDDKKYIVVGLDGVGVFLCRTPLDLFNTVQPKTLEEAKFTKEYLSREYPNIQYFIMELKDHETRSIKLSMELNVKKGSLKDE